MPIWGVIVNDRTAYEFGPFVLEAAERRLMRHGEPVALAPRAFDVLVFLVAQAGRLVSKQDVFDRVWRGALVTDGALTQCVRQIRAVLGDDAASPRYVATVPRAGYRFIAPVSQASPRAAVRGRLPVPVNAAHGKNGGGARTLYLRGRAARADVLERNQALLRDFFSSLGPTAEVMLVVVEQCR